MKKSIQFDIISIFPEMFDCYFNSSILSRAQKKKLIKIKTHNLRKWTRDKHKKVDDKPYGGGPGMVMMVEPFDRAVRAVKTKNKNTRVILLSARGKKFTQKHVNRLKKYNQVILLCGRYEGVDERVAKKIADEEMSIGDYVLTGGELGAMVIIDAISRHIPGVLGKQTSLAEESHTKPGYLEYPQYSRPETYKSWKVPKILLSGNHAEIKKWREKTSKTK
ncbi:tRNA (guanosine(37)-N1)-methyltransferase TrmD [Patescibacteria group bacterium]|nr:tRNA (guanosine(37)-N1)-methyltransferase TrmD [Patescibacteria group bacterium]MBU1921887.1 tRNA (guanosine(37)-N1)-methyltransferase TrmD [Patescibacteria group bacterium]